jgi:hypothetical protein
MSVFIRNTLIMIFCIGILIIPSSQSSTSTQVTWSNEIINSESHYWKATRSQLRDLSTEEKYDENHMVGGINVPRGGTQLYIENYNGTFDFINGDRLDIFLVVEGDMIIETPDYVCDYHLLLLPIKINITNFFDLLFEHVDLLENLTQSKYISSNINSNLGYLKMKVNNSLNSTYIWDVTKGILLSKTVVGLSGRSLHVEYIGTDRNPSLLPIDTISLNLAFLMLIVFYRKFISNQGGYRKVTSIESQNNFI